MNLLHQSLRAWAQYREFKAVMAELSSRSDDELAAIGATRADLARIAYAEAERRIVAPDASSGEPAPSPALGWYRARPA